MKLNMKFNKKQLQRYTYFYFLIVTIVLFFMSGTFVSSELIEEEYSGIYSGNQRVGFTKVIFSNQDNILSIKEYSKLRLKLLGIETDMITTSEYLLKNNKIQSFKFNLTSSDINLESNGVRNGNELLVRIKTVSGNSTYSITLENEPVVAPYAYRWIAQQGLEVGKKYQFTMFEPITLLMGAKLSEQIAVIEISDREIMDIPLGKYETFKLKINYNGSESDVWLTQDGEVIKDKSTIGIIAIKEDEKKYEDAILSIVDITEKTAISSKEKIKNPRKLNKLRIKITGIDNLEDFDIDDYRQTLNDDILTIIREDINFIKHPQPPVYNDKTDYLGSTNLIQSDNIKIVNISKEITNGVTDAYEKAKLLNTWIYQNLDKQPTISIPFALDILKTKRGDCNEHVVLFAAFSRALNIPTKIILGIVYINHKFYYHAWNEVFIGRWVSVDPTFNQFPVDASHIKFLEGDISRSSEIMKLVGKLKINILDS